MENHIICIVCKNEFNILEFEETKRGNNTFLVCPNCGELIKYPNSITIKCSNCASRHVCYLFKNLKGLSPKNTWDKISVSNCEFQISDGDVDYQIVRIDPDESIFNKKSIFSQCLLDKPHPKSFSTELDLVINCKCSKHKDINDKWELLRK